MQKLDLGDEISYSFEKGKLSIEVPGYAKKKVENIIYETRFTQPYVKNYSFEKLFEGIDEDSFMNDIGLYMFQILPSSLEKIDFERYNVMYLL